MAVNKNCAVKIQSPVVPQINDQFLHWIVLNRGEQFLGEIIERL
ncbi:MAG: hypothetical protein ACOC5S_02235 [Acidobacteriota bacterium]